jgi:hypothetical protein
MEDDRVNMHYIVDRLENILDDTNQKEEKVIRELEDLKRELIYNLGVNSRIKRKKELVEEVR